MHVLVVFKHVLVYSCMCVCMYTYLWEHVRVRLKNIVGEWDGQYINVLLFIL